jgi:hypothetical protein
MVSVENGFGQLLLQWCNGMETQKKREYVELKV